MYFSPLSYVDADVVIICYSVSNPDSLGNVLERWLPEVRHFCASCPIILAGNKVDLRPTVTSAGNPTADDVTVTSRSSRSKYVSTEEGEKAAEQIGASRFIECSAKTHHGVQDVFLSAASAAINVRRHQLKHNNCAIL